MSGPSTVATESSKSTMVVTADSSTTSATPAASAAPTGWARSNRSSIPSPWWSRSSADGSSGDAAVAVQGGGVAQADAGSIGPLGDERPRGRVHGVAHDLGMRPTPERHDVVEEGARPGDDACAAGRIVRPGLGQVAHGVGAVERVVQRTPPRVGGVDGVAGVRRRHDELRTRQRGDLGVHARRVDLERLPARHQVADRVEERPVGGGIVGLGGMGPVPLVDLRLQPIAHGQHLAMPGREGPHELGQPVPDLVRGDARARHELGGHEVEEGRVDPQAADLDVRSRYSAVTPSPFAQSGVEQRHEGVHASVAGIGVSVSRPSSTNAPISGSISRGRPASTSCSIDVLWAPTFSAPSMRCSMEIRRRSPSSLGDLAGLPHHLAPPARASTGSGRSRRGSPR